MASHRITMIDPPMAFFYLSFCDPTLPAGTQFLGATVIEADCEDDIPTVAWNMGRNPGGEIAFVLLEGVTGRADVPDQGKKYFDRFVPRDEVMAEQTAPDTDEDVRNGTICASCNPAI